jgi:hypothetical protein
MAAHFDFYQAGEFIHRLAHGNIDPLIKDNHDDLISRIHLAFRNVSELISLISQLLY